MEIDVSEEFKKAYSRLPLEVRKKAKKQERFFRLDPFHPSLNMEKLQPKGNQLWSLRVDKSYRILFKFLNNNTAFFITIGPHDWIYKRKI